MNRNEFLEKMKDILQYEGELDFDTNLLDLDEWDSLSQIATIAFFDSDLNKKITYDELNSMVKIEDIYNRTKN